MMKSNIKITLIAIGTMAVGLIAGYFIFSPGEPIAGDAQSSGSEATITAKEEEWICSMHPQIRQAEPGLCPICEMDLIPAGSSSQSDDPLILQMTESAIQLANIQTTIIGEGNNAEGKIIRLSGKIQPDERLASSQVAHVPGRIEKLYVSFTGEQVTKGQKIAELYSPQLITAQRELIEALKLQDLNPDLIEAARNKLRYWKISDEAIEQIEKKSTIQKNFTIYADESGIVTNRRVSVGDYLMQGEPLFDLMNLSRVWVLLDAYEEDLPHIAIGDKIEFSTPSVPGRTFNTKVTFIDPIINSKTRVASIRTEVSNQRGALKPEMLVYGKLAKRGEATLLAIPKTAVMWTGQRSVIYVKIPDSEIPSFEYREIEIGEALGQNYQVLSGIEIGEEVVTNGSFTIDAAAQLNNQASMMNRNVSIEKDEKSEALLDYTDIAPQQFKNQLSDLAKTYLELKDALVATDSRMAKSSAQKVLESVGQVDMSLLKGEAHDYWMEQLDALQVHTEKIGISDDIENQRKQFDFLSQTLIQTIKVFGIGAETLYVQHCPMANNDQGADWISDVKEIRNPYFGDKMMKCGVVKTTLDTTFRN